MRRRIIVVPIHVILTGGTIDAHRIDSDGKYIFEDSYVENTLKQAISIGPFSEVFEFTFTKLFMKDSLDMTDDDRKAIYDTCLGLPAGTRILITHGTDTMIDTAKLLRAIPDRYIAMTGAMIPISSDSIDNPSDGPRNLAQSLHRIYHASIMNYAPGVIICMHGEIFDDMDDVYKDKMAMEFKRISGGGFNG